MVTIAQGAAAFQVRSACLVYHCQIVASPPHTCKHHAIPVSFHRVCTPIWPAVATAAALHSNSGTL